MRIVPPGDDVCPVPPPVVEVPPYDRFCDLVMTGGVASGVVYPWAIVELARCFRFRNIGGSSVGAMAAALAAAAEYGRRVGFDQSFEALRRTPGALGEGLPDQRTRMLSLFQANASGRRLVRLWGRLGRGSAPGADPEDGARATPSTWNRVRAVARVAAEVIRAYRFPLALGALTGWVIGNDCGASTMAKVLLTLAGLSTGLGFALWDDIRDGVIDNCLGLCKGGTLEDPGPEGKRPGLSEWLHEGIQAGAGLKETDRPLTFRDLWCAPATPGAPHLPCKDDDPLDRRSINLQVITTNVAHGRPYRLPLCDETSRLFYKPEELKDYFPKSVLDALVAASRRYAPRRASDPVSIQEADAFRELPDGDLPIVVAARLSLSFPLLFSAVPLWAIDYEAERGQRDALKRCLFTDGGASSNFPIHLFDAAMPCWPTFGFWLDRKDPKRPPARTGQDVDVFLPEFVGQGWGDSWNRFDPLAAATGCAPGKSSPVGFAAHLKFLGGFLLGIATSATDWHDRTSIRLPQVRTRVARLMLAPGEGGLHIGMPRAQILDMAHRYGTKSGQLFVHRFADRDGQASPAWREQRWVRLVVLINGLREHLEGLKPSAEWSAHTVPMSRAIAQAKGTSPIRNHGGWNRREAEQVLSLETLLNELERLEGLLQVAESRSLQQVPTPELRLRAPL